MKSYYDDKLSAARLARCYEIAPPRVQEYLEAEINHVLGKISPGSQVLELGCGYGRVLQRIAGKAGSVMGIDTSLSSLLLAQELLRHAPNCFLLEMHALRLALAEDVFDAVVCVQNGISAFHVEGADVIRESIRVTKGGGRVFLSSYSEKFWKHRLEWFQLQSDAGLVGEIDFEKTAKGVIVCKDGFVSGTVGIFEFRSMTREFSDAEVDITEVDESSLFCEIVPHKKIKLPVRR